ncbi:copper homeostasis membrane protein CopD [Achromobacter piechaudii]|uniref:copper homeostasis membrane protein CopD n=1 Tax=Achromobacter piechaudii TaxID=72556 RepID=UPI003DA85949
MLTAFALCRFLGYSASVLLFGVSTMLALSGSRSLSLSVQSDLHRLLRCTAIVGVVAVFCLLPLQTASIADDWLAMVDADLLSTVAFQTRYGQGWCLRALAVMGVLALMLRGRPDNAWLRAAVAGLALASLSLTGHAAMQSGWIGVAHTANDALHALAAGFWLGSLPVFLGFLKRWQEPARRKDATRALMRFSTAGHAAVAVLLLSGAVNTWMILSPTGLDVTSLYLQLLLIKAALALAMVALAVFNRYRWIPSIRSRRDLAVYRIRRNTILELWAGGAVLLLVGFLGLLSPS